MEECLLPQKSYCRINKSIWCLTHTQMASLKLLMADGEQSCENSDLELKIKDC